ncbi:MAG: hypothetical protein L6Q97_22685, partial [Thermoanaerobaculia bacterium]|nr:hypothetical protein [Thermoanaerobaculia bacterium]
MNGFDERQAALQNEIQGPNSNHTAEQLRFLPSRQKAGFISHYFPEGVNGETANKMTANTIAQA